MRKFEENQKVTGQVVTILGHDAEGGNFGWSDEPFKVHIKGGGLFWVSGYVLEGVDGDKPALPIGSKATLVPFEVTQISKYGYWCTPQTKINISGGGEFQIPL